jgi:hypothetical protein
LPFRLVDGINPVLNLHNHASVLLDNTRLVSLVEKSLGLLESGSSCLQMLEVIQLRVQNKTHRFVKRMCRSGRPADR